ncbi:MAG: tyrosine-protein phosphatase [Lentisphaeria bacterium]|nr:tyrosine-protein phosphatase [Lentisphaeria bacterium]
MTKIRIRSPQENAEVSLLRPDWEKRVRDLAECNDAGGAFQGDAPEPFSPDPCLCCWEGGTPPYTLTFSSGEDGSIGVSALVPYAFVWNLMTDRVYTLRIADAAGETAETVFRTAAGPRLIRFPVRPGGPNNFRDLGSWSGPQENRICQGRVYRGSACREGSFPEENRRLLTDFLRIRTELDLRYTEQIEAEKIVSSPLGPDVHWIHLPVNAYHAFEPEQCALFRQVIQVFADAENYPVFFHCSQGCDRTGEIAILLKALCGEDPETIFLDYELSSLYGFPRPRQIGYLTEWLGGIAAFSGADLPLEEQVRRYLLAVGVSAAEIEAVRRNLRSAPGVRQLERSEDSGE